MAIIEKKSDFQALVERERARADRIGHDFSIIAFDLPDKTGSRRDMEAMLFLIRKRVRLYDEIGVFDSGRIMVLMPHAGYAQASTLARSICELFQGESSPAYSIYTYPGGGSAGAGQDSAPAGGTWADMARRLSLSRTSVPLWKRCMDVTGAAIGVVALLPVLAAVAAFIKAVSPGPALYRQVRVGHLGARFNCLKFRTMHLEAGCERHTSHLRQLIASDVPMQKLDVDDPRIIPCGRLLRATGLDELPQLFNVLRGDMSLIGPRPCIPYEAREFKPWQRSRFDAVPGITGLWQVNGKNRTTFTEMIRYDLRYAATKNFLTDLAILMKTVPAIIGQVLDQNKPAMKQGGQTL